MKSEQVIAVLIVVSLVCTALFLTGNLMGVFYVVMGEESYQVTLQVELNPVLNNREELIDVEVILDSDLRIARVPHEVVWEKSWGKFRKDTYGSQLFGDDDGTLNLGLYIKLENFTHTLFDHYEGITTPKNHIYSFYCFLEDGQTHGILQLTVTIHKTLTLITLRNSIVEEISYIEKFEV